MKHESDEETHFEQEVKMQENGSCRGKLNPLLKKMSLQGLGEGNKLSRRSTPHMTHSLICRTILYGVQSYPDYFKSRPEKNLR